MVCGSCTCLHSAPKDFNLLIENIPQNHFIYLRDPAEIEHDPKQIVGCTCPIVPKDWVEALGFFSDTHENDIFTTIMAEKTKLYSQLPSVQYKHKDIRSHLRFIHENVALNSMQSYAPTPNDQDKFNAQAEIILEYCRQKDQNLCLFDENK